MVEYEVITFGGTSMAESNDGDFAVRIINIPEAYFNTAITARPYYNENDEDVQITVYGAEKAASVNSVSEIVL